MVINSTRTVAATVVLVLVTLASICQAGPVYQADFTDFDSKDSRWIITKGKWTDHKYGVESSNGENRLFIADLAAKDGGDYAISANVTIESGKGWAIFFDGKLDKKNRYTGLNIQFDPGYGKGAVLLRRWKNNSESVITRTWFDKDLDVYGKDHTLSIERSPGLVVGYLDNRQVFSEKLSDLNGGIMGFRTWGWNSDVTFHSLRAKGDIYGDAVVVPEPFTITLLATGGLLVFIRRRSK